jgi:protein TonB
MAQTQFHPIHTARLRAKLDPTRIGADTGTIAINAVLLLLLLAPVAPRLVEQPPADDMQLVPVVRVPARVVPPPALPVETRPTTPSPVTRAQPETLPRYDAPAEDIVAPSAGDIAIDPIGLETTRPSAATGIGIAQTADIGASLRALSAPPPPYPREALLHRVEGTVVLDVHVDAQGCPVDVVIVTSSGHRTLDRAAQRQVLKKWRFRPALQDGRAVPALGRVPVSFVLER